jgi:hypothetical protein
MGSVCSLIAYVRSWVSEIPATGIGPEQIAIWQKALRRAMEFRQSADPARFTDVGFTDLNADPVGAVAGALEALGIGSSGASRDAVSTWAGAHPRGADGRHEFTLGAYDLTPDGVRAAFDFYLERYGDLATTVSS